MGRGISIAFLMTVVKLNNLFVECEPHGEAPYLLGASMHAPDKIICSFLTNKVIN